MIPNFDDFQMLKKINLGKNLIKKVEYIKEFQKLKYIQEIVLEGNPVLSNPDILRYINNIPLKGYVINIANVYPKTPIPHSAIKSNEFLSSDTFKSLLINNDSCNISPRNDLNDFSIINNQKGTYEKKYKCYG